jgi:hypothetical protein
MRLTYRVDLNLLVLDHRLLLLILERLSIHVHDLLMHGLLLVLDDLDWLPTRHTTTPHHTHTIAVGLMCSVVLYHGSTRVLSTNERPDNVL